MRINLHVAFPDGAARSFEYAGSVIGIGRDPTCELAFDAEDANKAASWRHARIEINSKGAYLIDLNSSNGTFVNGRRASGRERLQPGDQIAIGQTGPKLTITRLDLSIPDAVPEPVTLRQAVRPSVRPAPIRNPAPMVAAAPVAEGPSETRMLLVQMRQRHTNWFKWGAIGGGAVFVLIAAILIIHYSRIGDLREVTKEMGEDVAQHEKDIKKITRQVAGLKTVVDRNTRDISTLSKEVRDILGAIDGLEKNQDHTNRMLAEMAGDITGQAEQSRCRRASGTPIARVGEGLVHYADLTCNCSS